MINLETERTTLRPLRASDAEQLFRIQSKADTMRFLGGTSVSAERIRSLIELDASKYSDTGFGMCAVILKSSQKLIGRCGLFTSDVDGIGEVELSYLIDVESASRGLATECGTALVEHGRINLGLKRIVALINPANLASIRVAEKIGFQYERLRVEPTEFGDSAIYCLSLN